MQGGWDGEINSEIERWRGGAGADIRGCPMVDMGHIWLLSCT